MKKIYYTVLFLALSFVCSAGLMQAQGTDATLSDINLNTGVLVPEFDPAITQYVALIPDGVDILSVEAVLNDDNASLLGGGEVVVANSEMTTITVTAENGQVKTEYVVFIANENCYDPLSIHKVNLAPNPIMSELTGYYAGWGSKTINTNLDFVYCGKTSAKISGACGGSIDFSSVKDVIEDGKSYLISAMFYVDGTGKAQLGHTLNGVSLKTRTTKTKVWEEVRIVVDITSLNTSANIWFNSCNGIGAAGDVVYVDNFQMYEVNRNNNLAALSSDVGTLVPEFSPDVTEYYLLVEEDVNQVNLSAEPALASAEVAGDGLITLVNDSAFAEITVSAESGEVKSYKVIIDNAIPDADASLSSLSTDVGTLSPDFDPEVMSYTLDLPDGTKEITLTATPNSSEATLIGDGLIDIVANGAVAHIVVTAEKGNQQTYTIKWDAISPYSTSSSWSVYDGGQAPSVSGYMDILFMPVTESVSDNSLLLAGDQKTASIYYSAEDAAVVGIAANALRDDIERVTGLVPAVSTEAPATKAAVFIGTIGHSPLIDSLIASGQLDVSAIENKWEAYTAKVLDNPMEGVDRALIIAGSDRRGTAFGVFALSESMGVSPWYFWGDVAVPHKEALYVAGSYTQTSPGVKYRGIFLNDEDWGLNPWASKTFEPEVGNIGPKTYATIFELLLRLQANCIWPAMHEFPVVTAPFYTVPGNMEMADDYAIVISTSHHEPMMRNSHEYDTGVLGEYNYWTNREAIYNFWEERVKETSTYENIYTIGMRGRDDSGMKAPAGTTDAQKAAKIQDQIIPDQRQMITDYVHKDAEDIPQIFIPYKETLVQYQSGLTLPDDVTIVWPDDNHGYIRQLSTAQERMRSGGSGVYYHLSYWGVPTSYLWFCTTPPGMTCSEMMKAWDFDASKIWLVNVGDLKPMEQGTDFFLRMARNPEAFRNFDQQAYFTEWARSAFDANQAASIAEVLDKYYQLNIVKRAEHLDRSNSGFSHVDNGDEAQQRLDEFEQLFDAANAIYDALPTAQKTAFYEMVLYPVRATYYVNKRTLLAERSRLWAAQKRAETNALAAEAKAAHAALLNESTYYNKTNANGKWDFMVNPMETSLLSSWARETQNPFIEPAYGNYSAPSTSGIAVVIEGSGTPLAKATPVQLPTFNRPADSQYFIDVFNLGSASSAWTATADYPWVILSQSSGHDDARIMVSMDWDSVPKACNVPAMITIQSNGVEYLVNLNVYNPQSLDLSALPDAVENNGKVEIEAEHFSAQKDAGEIGWRDVNRATASKDGMTIQPVTASSYSTANLSSAPSLTYQFHTFSTGPVRINTQCLPTHRITSEYTGVRYAISLNGDTPQLVDIYAKEYSSAWYVNTRRAASIGTSHHSISEPGLQTLKIYMVDAGVVLDKITVHTDGVYEVEDLKVEETNTSVLTYFDTPASGGEGVHIQSTSAGKYATFVIPDVKANDYVLKVRVKKWGSRGIVKMSVAEQANGTYSTIGTNYDLYNSSELYTDLAPVSLSFATDGPKYLRFDVTGKNASASNYWVLLDYFSLKPLSYFCDEVANRVSHADASVVRVCPTVSDGYFTVFAEPGATITVYGITGAPLFEQRATAYSSDIMIEPSGVFFIHVDSAGVYNTFKVVVT